MTTSSFSESNGHPIFKKGRMYKTTNTEDLVVLCTYVHSDRTTKNTFLMPLFEGTVIHQGKSQYQVGDHINSWCKHAFADFHGEVVLES